MPKRIGGGLLGHHRRHTHNKFYQAPKQCNFILLMIDSLLLPFLPNTTLDLLFHLLLLFTILTAISYNINTFANMLLKCFLRDAPPPWAKAKQCLFIPRPRHHRKHGHYKLVPAYPTIHLKHLLMFLPLMFQSSTSQQIDSLMESKLSHISWAPSIPTPTFLLEYFEVDIPSEEDPSNIVKLINFLDDTTNIQLTKQHAPLYFSLVDGATCYTSSTSDPPLIVDTGASVCISPVKSDFKTYHTSNMRIKDLSLSNSVAGEGLIHWNVMDINKKQVTLALPGFHIPTAEV